VLRNHRKLIWPAIVVSLSACGGGGGSSDDESPPPAPTETPQIVLSGTIQLESRTRVDSDTADSSRISRAIDNDSANDAQPVPPFVTQGGYLSLTSGVYANDFQGRYVADPVDVYEIKLHADDRLAVQPFLTLDAAQASQVTRIRLINSDGIDVCVDRCNLGENSVFVAAESEAGSYTLFVEAVSGTPRRYVLSMSNVGSANSMISPSEDDVIIGEAIVITADEQMSETFSESLSAAGTQAFSAESGRMLGPGVLHLRKTFATIFSATNRATERVARQQTLEWISELRNRADVIYAEPNVRTQAFAVTPGDDALYRLQWNIPQINLPVAWQVAPGAGQGVGIAVLDTGLFNSNPSTPVPANWSNWHPDLVSRVISPDGTILDFVSGDGDIDSDSGLSNGWDTNPADPGDGLIQSSNFHGTHVAGIAVASDNFEGIVGVAPQASLIPVRVLGRQGKGSLADLIDALDEIGRRSDVDVINLSLGGLSYSAALEGVIDSISSSSNASGAKLVVAAAGNSATDAMTYPAAFSQVVGVGAVDAGGVRASYSNFGVYNVDVMAPGGDVSRDGDNDGNADRIISAWGLDDRSDGSGGKIFQPIYAGLQGTSMAAPHVAGLYALMKEAAEATSSEPMTPSRFRSLLIAGELTQQGPNRAEYGYGLIDAAKAVNAATSGAMSEVVAAEPSTLNFRSDGGASAASCAEPQAVCASVVLQTYPETAEITNLSLDISGVDWVELDSAPPATVQGDASFTVRVNDTGLALDEVYRGTLLIRYDGDVSRTLQIPVTLQLGDPPDARDAGRMYVLLTTTDANPTTVAELGFDATGGQYSFGFSGVPDGSYYLVAGTDMDNNGFICETGEACAEYPLNGLPQALVIEDGQVLNGLNMTASFRRPTLSTQSLMLVPADGAGIARLKPETSQGVSRRVSP